MKYSLFIDESGDFHHSKEWIVSGILCPYDKETSEKYLKKTLNHLPKRFGLSSHKEMHLTELRQERGHNTAAGVADTIFSALHASQYKWNLVVTRNQTKFGLSDPERTYRLMLLDLIALAEATIPESFKLSRLEIVIATRTDSAGKRMTTLVDLNKDVVARISDSLEAGIASRGMIDFLDSKGLEITTLQANKSWGLIVADFICNISYNHSYPKELEILEKLKRIGFLSEFQSFGGYQERRARIAERDGNFIDAIRRWAYIDYKKEKEKIQQIEKITQLFNKIVTFGTSGPRSTLDAIIEHIWRDKSLIGDFERTYQIANRLEIALTITYKNEKLTQILPLLFRIQNFMHLVANKIGDTNRSKQLIEKKKQLKSQIALTPESLPLILDSQLYEIDTTENELLLNDCLALARSHCALVQLYKECWELLVDDNMAQGFDSSRINIKAEMTLLRSEILVGKNEALDAALTRISRLKKIIIDPADKRRLLNYEILSHIKGKEYGEALMAGIKDLNSTSDRFLTQHLLCAIVSGLLSNEEKYQNSGMQLLSLMEQRIIPESGHPVDLIWRDWGMLHYILTGDKKVALRYLKRSQKHLAQMPKSTNVVQWLQTLLSLHVAFINEKPYENENFSFLSSQIQINEIPSLKNHSNDRKDLLLQFRHKSPY